MNDKKINKFDSIFGELRKEKGMTRNELADKLNVSVRLIGYWERGERECSLDTLIKICDLFGVSADYLLGRRDY